MNVSQLLIGDEITLIARIRPLDGSKILLMDYSGGKKVKVTGEKSQALLSLPCETMVEVHGVLTESGELLVEDFRVLHEPLKPEKICVDKVPDDPLEYAERYHLYVRHPSMLRVVKTYSAVVGIMRHILDSHGFTELPAPIIGHTSDPGLRGARKAAIEAYGRVYEVQSSVIMYKQLYASLLSKIYYTARNFRIEPPENAYTGRHLAEFTQLDVEASLSSAEDLMHLAEEVVYGTIRSLIEDYSSLLSSERIEFLEKTITKPPYPRISYDEAVDILKQKGFIVEYGKELSFDAEAALGELYGTPVWVTGFPTTSRGFYYIPDPGRPGYNVDYNLILPSHAGEVLDGGCREYRYEKLVERIRLHGEPLEKYKWFLELAEAGAIQPSCGWGLGVERLVRYIHGLKHVAYASPHPRLPGVIGP